MATVNGSSRSFSISGYSCSWKAVCDYPASGSGTATVKLVISTPSGISGSMYVNVTAYIDGSKVGSWAPGNTSIPVTHTVGSITVGQGSHSFKMTFSGSGISGVNGNSTGSFTVAATTYTVTYNANGGSGAPSPQTAEVGTAITIPQTKPTKDATISSPYVVTFNSNNGVVDTPSLTSYLRTGNIFSSWQDSVASGTYQPGDSYTAPSGSTAITMTAQYVSSTARDSLVLPSGSRNGYILKGFGTSSSSTTSVSNPYTPSADITLYAIWEQRKDRVKYKNGSDWVAATSIKMNYDGEWYNANNWYIPDEWNVIS